MANPESPQSLVFVTTAGERVGLAFFVDETHLLTCAHVVASCFEESDRKGDLRGKIISCEFLTGAEQRAFKTRVEIYRPAIDWGVGTPAEQRYSDIAVLRLETPPANLPLRPDPVRLFAPQTPNQVVLKGATTDDEGMIKIATGKIVT